MSDLVFCVLFFSGSNKMTEVYFDELLLFMLKTIQILAVIVCVIRDHN